MNASKDQKTQVIVAGGGTGGVAATLAAARWGASVIMTEETDWIGGQLTQQAVPPDEHPWIERFGCTATYRRFRDLVREYYRAHFPLTLEARRNPILNPGSGWVGHFCHEPRIALAVLEGMLQPYLTAGQVTVLLRHKVIGAEKDGNRVKALRIKNLDSGEEISIEAQYVIDATELGDLLPLTGTEYVTGFESRKDTGEPSAPEEAQPHNQQAFTCCFLVEHRPGENHTIDRPEQYNFWREYVPSLTPEWPGPLLSLTMTNPVTGEPRPMSFDPTSPGMMADGKPNLFTYRQVVDPANMLPGTFPGTNGVSCINWPQNDYLLGNLVDITEEEFQRHVEGGIQLSLSLLYWLQTEAPRPDGGTGWPGLRLRGDMLGTDHGCAKYPYIREARRIRGEFTVCEQHISVAARMEATGKAIHEITAEQFDDSAGIGAYRIDLHPTTTGDNYLDVAPYPFQIPLGALIPRDTENLLAAAKNLSVTHITNGCYRVHPVEWNIGEAAGALAAYALNKRETPRTIRNQTKLLRDFQCELKKAGVELDWPVLRLP